MPSRSKSTKRFAVTPAYSSFLIMQIRLARAGLALIVLLVPCGRALAQTDVLIEIDRGRTEGIVNKTPVYQRAILSKPAQATDTALLFFRGNPGITRIRSVDDKTRNYLPFMRMNLQLFLNENIALVLMDCPTDRWNDCPESYRLSAEHADDVRSVMRVLKEQHGITQFYVMGHSMGAASSRGLAKSLGSEIAGSIHSSAMNVAARNGFGVSFANFPYDALPAPQLHIHNENDACRSTPYAAVKAYAGANLTTVKGGTASGDPCGGGHLHSHQGREAVVVKAIIAWIRAKRVDSFIGE